ncbi:MAG: hypothetical protein H6728_11470 [Myxococcales bacterium]|nr:hypothetical protein [Myxococcales bacterium]MCB9643682.1 hypothetical protein [Myxococcales bacterium]
MLFQRLVGFCCSFVLCLVVWVSLPQDAQADALYLRLPLRGQSVGFVAGFPEVSVGGWILDRVGASLEFRPLDTAIGGSMGTRIPLWGESRGWQIDLLLAASVRFPVSNPFAEVSVIPALGGHLRLERLLFSVQLSLPVALQFAQPLLFRQSSLLDIWFMGRLGPLWLGIQGGVGPRVVVTGGLTKVEVEYQSSLVLIYQLDGKKE